MYKVRYEMDDERERERERERLNYTDCRNRVGEDEEESQ